jgi:cell wall-associated NlpC family hydrolase
VPAPTPSLATRAAVVATGTTAAALLALLPATPPAPVPTAVVSAWARPAADEAGGAVSPGFGPAPAVEQSANPPASFTLGRRAVPPRPTSPAVATAPFEAALRALGTTPATPAVRSSQAVAAAPQAAPAAPARLVAAPVKAPAAAAAKPAAAPAFGRRSSAMANAMSKLGAAYRWGATGPRAFDCSGLVYWSYRQVGMTLPRTSSAQSRVGAPVSRSALQPGDLVFFYRPVSHVAIYIGNGRVVHASTSGSPVKISNLNDMPFATARRI